MLGTYNRNCCQCNSCNSCQEPCPTKCRSQLTQADLGDIVYLQGLDENLCPKFEPVEEVLGLVDCEGEPLPPGTEVVTCENLQLQLCEILDSLPIGAPQVPGVTHFLARDCQFHQTTETPLTVVDTNTVDLTASGTFGHTLQADVIISPEDGNILEALPDGLYANICTGVDNLPIGVPSVPGVTHFIAGDCQLHVLTETPLQVVDTLTVNLTASGDFGHTLQADVNISAQPDNQVEVLPDGIYVPPADAETPITVIDTNTVNLTVSGPNLHTLQADVEISDVLGNDLEALPDGLYVSVCETLSELSGPVNPATPGVTVLVGQDCNRYTLPPAQSPLSVLDTLTIDHTLAANVLSSNVIVSGVADNQVEVLPDGIYVPPADPQVTCQAIQAVFTDSPLRLQSGERVLVDTCETKIFPTFSAQDTDSVDMSVLVDGSGNYLISAVTSIATSTPGYPNGCNGLVDTPDGLAAPPDIFGSAQTTPIAPLLYNAATVNGQVFVSLPVTITVTNNSNCRNAIALLALRLPGIVQSEGPLGENRIEFEILHDFNFPLLVTGLTPVTRIIMQHRATGDRPGTASPASTIINPVMLGPGDSGTYSGVITFTQSVGALDNLRIDPIVLRSFVYTI